MQRDERQEPARWRELFAEGRGRLTLGLVMVELMAGLQSLLVTTILPRAVRDLGGVQFYGWVFSAYMLAGLVSIPRTARQADERGPAAPLARMMAVFAAGTALCGVAPSMPLLAAARLVQGYGGGALYSMGYGVVAKAYPESKRARVLALLTAVWVVSGLVGPSFGALVAGTIGWRWAFFLILPLPVLAGSMVVPAIRRLPHSDEPLGALPIRWPLLLAAGCALMVVGFSGAWWIGILTLALGLAVAAPTLSRVLPKGTLRARPGLPATVVISFFLSLAFFTADSFVPLLLTGVRGRSVGEAGIAVTIVSVTWSVAGWWQSRAVASRSHLQLVRWGSVVLALGTAGFAAALLGAPLVVSYVSWGLAGAGMGVAFPTVLLAAMGSAEAGDEASAVAARFISSRLGVILGSGFGGAFVAVSRAMGSSLSVGLAGTYSLAVAAAVATVVLAPLLVASQTLEA